MTSVGIDTGGTFTDVAVYDPGTGAISVTKVPSTPDEPDEAVMVALAEVDAPLDEVERIVHGTTAAGRSTWRFLSPTAMGSIG